MNDEEVRRLAESFKTFDSNDRLLLLSLWGMRPNWTPPEHVQRAYNVSYNATPWPKEEK